MCHSCTNYECYKGLYSSLNDLNLFEIAYSLKRQFGSEPWCLYQGKHLLSFVDNHDVTRAASILLDRNHLPLLYGLLFGMPGIPCIYYGSEWGAEGRKAPGSDANLRPCFPQPEWNRLTGQIAAMAKAGGRARLYAKGTIGKCCSPTGNISSSGRWRESGCWWWSTPTANPTPPILTPATAGRWTCSQERTTTSAEAANFPRTAWPSAV